MTSTSGCIPASITLRSNPTEACLSAGLIFCVKQLPANHRAFHLATRYASFNSLTVTGRIFNSEVVTTKDGTQFLSVSLISTATKDGEDIVYTFTNNNGLMTLFNNGHLPKGREITLVGHISSVSQVYTDKKTGEVRLRQRPEVHLIGVMIPDGGLGRTPAEATAKPAAGTVVKMTTKAAPVDETPQLTKEEAQAAAF